MNIIDNGFSLEIRRIRNSIERSNRKDFVTTYTEREYLNGKTANERVLILRTRGCSWSYHSGCSMCGFWEDTNPNIKGEDIEKQVDEFLQMYPKGDVLKVFTSGSFLDPLEIPKDKQATILKKLEDSYDFVIIETRPEHVNKSIEMINKYAGKIQVAIGLESTNPKVLKYSINKNYTFEDYKRAALLLHENGISVRTYVLLKPPFLTEREAIEDSVNTIKDVIPYSDIISLNPLNVQKGTYVEYLYKSGRFRPPFLWSVIEVLIRTKNEEVPVVSLITGAGKKRGAHNGHTCDGKVSEAIRKYSETWDYSYIEKLDCQCKLDWENFKNAESKISFPIGEFL